MRPAQPYRGELVDVGGRRLRVVRAGVGGDRPLVVCEHGAFGCAADWAVVQARLAARGFPSLAYDRAGLGHSEPGPHPRDGASMVKDLDTLLRTVGETRPVILTGHSMGGLMVRLFALQHPERVAGLVLVDAMTPEVILHPAGRALVEAFGGLLRLAGFGARYGLMRPVALVTGNLIGLTDDAAREKRRIHGSHPHAVWAAEEVAQWSRTSAQAGAAELPADLPVAVITAGKGRALGPLTAMQAGPALRSRRGYVEDAPGANHSTLLGRRFADPVVRGVEHVARAAAL